MPTIKDVAKDAGVSPSTVSRVINSNPKISKETSRKVRESMKKIGYYPNSIAQSLVNQKTDTIGLVMPYSPEEAFADPFYAEILRGIGGVAQKKGYSLLLITSNGSEEEFEASIKAVKGKRVDGLLILRSRKDDILVKELKKLKFPYMIIGRPEDEDNNYWVNNDNLKSSSSLVEYLIKLGHKRIGLITGSKEYIVYQDRIEGYKSALKNNGIDYKAEYVIETTRVLETNKEVTKKLIKANQELTAIFAVDDMMAYGAILAIKELNMKVPDDISIVGFNNDLLSRLINPSLTTVDINTHQLGSTATENLIKIINNNSLDYYHELVPTTLVKRDSCGEVVGLD